MDFKLFGAVIKRYRRGVILGAVLAVVLSVLSYGMPGFKGGKPTIIPRGAEVWQGNAVLLLSQVGNPYARAVDQVIPGKGLDLPSQAVGDLTYMANLSSVYAATANGDALDQQVAAEAHVRVCPVTTTATAPPAADAAGGACGTVVAAALEQQGTGAALPLITLTSSAPTAREAAKLSTTAISVLRSQITTQQAAADTPVNQRVVLQTINDGTPATLEQGYSKSIPILVLFAVMSASIALAFIRNNHSDNPVRSTRKRPDDGLAQGGRRALAYSDNANGVGSGNGHGHAAEPGSGAIHTGGGRIQLMAPRRPAPGPRSGFDAESRD